MQFIAYRAPSMPFHNGWIELIKVGLTVNGRNRLSMGFSLIELVITLAVLCVCLAIGFPQYREYVVKARIVAALSDIAPGKVEVERRLGLGWYLPSSEKGSEFSLSDSSESCDSIYIASPRVGWQIEAPRISVKVACRGLKKLGPRWSHSSVEIRYRRGLETAVAGWPESEATPWVCEVYGLPSKYLPKGCVVGDIN